MPSNSGIIHFSLFTFHYYLLKDFFQFVLQRLRPKPTSHNLSLRVDQQVVGDAVHAIDLRGYRIPSLQVGEVRPRHLQLGNVLHPRFLLIVEREPHNIKALVVIFLVGCHHIRHLSLARSAPRSPEVHEHPFALAHILAQLVHLAVRISLLQIDELLTHEGLLLLFQTLLIGSNIQLALHDGMTGTLMAERVEVLRGPASVLYGSNAMGGVMNIVTRQAKQDGVNTNIQLGAGSYGTIQTEASNQVRSGRFSSTVSAQYGGTDNHRPRMGFEQYGGYLKLGYDLSDHWNTYIDANITHFNASYPGTEDKPMYDADQWITRGIVSAALENHYGNTSGALSVYSNFGRHKIDDGTTDPATPTQRYFRSKDALTGVSLYQSIQLFEGNRVTAGVDYMHIYGNAYYTSKATGEILDTPNKQSGNDGAGHLMGKHGIIEKLREAGYKVEQIKRK